VTLRVQPVKPGKPHLWFDGKNYHTMYIYAREGWRDDPFEILHRSWEHRGECFEHAVAIQPYAYYGARYVS
jgi:hypothetical protein